VSGGPLERPPADDSLYWTNKDVLTFLAETTDEAHVQAVHAARKTKSAQSPPPTDGQDLTGQYAKSASAARPQFEGLRSNGGHKIQDVKELMKVPVIVMSDMTKSPPVLVVYACESGVIPVRTKLTGSEPLRVVNDHRWTGRQG
jgi:protein SSD1